LSFDKAGEKSGIVRCATGQAGRMFLTTITAGGMKLPWLIAIIMMVIRKTRFREQIGSLLNALTQESCYGKRAEKKQAGGKEAKIFREEGGYYPIFV
jgi:hypothetical protein